MAWIVRLVSLGADGAEHSIDVLRIAKPGDLTDLASLGLTLAEGKQLLAGLQQEIVAAQARVHAARRPVAHDGWLGQPICGEGGPCPRMSPPISA